MKIKKFETNKTEIKIQTIWLALIVGLISFAYGFLICSIIAKNIVESALNAN